MHQNQNILVPILTFFKLFGFIPYKVDQFSRSTKVHLNKFYAAGVVLFLAIYWFCLINFIFVNDSTSNTLTSISNYIQLLVNVWTLNIVLLFPLNHASTMDEILKCFLSFDARAALACIDLMKSKMNSLISASLICFLVYLCYMGIYEVFVVLFHHKLTCFVYWLITFIPAGVQLAAMTFSFCMLLLVHYRIKIIKKILTGEAVNLHQFQFPSKVYKVQSIEQSIRTSMPSIFHLYQDIHDLRLTLEAFLGPIFLSGFTSIFVITTTQTYHCYTLIVSGRQKASGYSFWNIGLCANIIVVNVLITIGLTTVCEMIAKQSNSCSRLILKMRLNGSTYFTSNEIQKMTEVFQSLSTDITFSAMGFFKVNYRMLCGMVNSIATYLIIYIQFYALYANENSSGFLFHNKNKFIS